MNNNIAIENDKKSIVKMMEHLKGCAEIEFQTEFCQPLSEAMKEAVTIIRPKMVEFYRYLEQIQRNEEDNTGN